MSEAKQELVRNWLLKASHDLTAARLLAGTDPAILDVAIYHCQQAGEKALKAFLIFRDQRVDKTHDLKIRLKKAMDIEAGLGSCWDAADRLTPYATAYRYPDVVGGPNPEQVQEAMDDAALVYNQVLASLPAEVHPESD
jgi:HEPN domain-containing protein